MGVDRARFRDKALAFLRAHKDHLVLAKLRMGHQLTALDLEQLEFTGAQVIALIATLRRLRESAEAS